MSGAGVMRIKKLKGKGIIVAAARHNKREIQAELGATGPIDPKRSCSNEFLTGPSTAASVGKLAKDLMTAAGVVKLRKDAVMGLEFVFSLPPGHVIDDRAYFTACAEWAGVAFGGAHNVLSADIHRDEAAPHCHVLLLPLIDGRMDGSNLLGGKQKLMALQKDFHAAVASKFGLSKAPARLAGTAKQAGAKAVLQHLRDTANPILKDRGWPAYRDAIEAAPAPFLLAYGLELATPKKKLRTFTQIMTSKGKGPAKEPNPIGFTLPKKEQTLCSVGFAPKPPLSAASPLPARPPPVRPPLGARQLPQRQPAIDLPEIDLPEIEAQAEKEEHDLDGETVRVRDDDLNPALYDFGTGSWPPQPAAEPALRRQAADAWVAAALPAKRTGAQRHEH